MENIAQCTLIQTIKINNQYPTITWEENENITYYKISVQKFVTKHSNVELYEGVTKNNYFHFEENIGKCENSIYYFFITGYDDKGIITDTIYYKILVVTEAPYSPTITVDSFISNNNDKTNDPRPVFMFYDATSSLSDITKISINNSKFININDPNSPTHFRKEWNTVYLTPKENLKEGKNTICLIAVDEMGNKSTILYGLGQNGTKRGYYEIFVKTTDLYVPKYTYFIDANGFINFSFITEDKDITDIAIVDNAITTYIVPNVITGKNVTYLISTEGIVSDTKHLELIFIDSFGNSVNDFIDIKIQKVNNDVITFYGNDKTNNQTYKFTWSNINQDLDYFNVWFDVNNKIKVTNSFYIPEVSMYNGVINFNVESVDIWGNVSNSFVKTITLNNSILDVVKFTNSSFINTTNPSEIDIVRENGYEYYYIIDEDFITCDGNIFEEKLSYPYEIDDGIHSLYVRRKDEFGNVSNSSIYDFIIDSKQPVIPKLYLVTEIVEGEEFNILISNFINKYKYFIEIKKIEDTEWEIFETNENSVVIPPITNGKINIRTRSFVNNVYSEYSDVINAVVVSSNIIEESLNSSIDDNNVFFIIPDDIYESITYSFGLTGYAKNIIKSTSKTFHFLDLLNGDYDFIVETVSEIGIRKRFKSNFNINYSEENIEHSFYPITLWFNNNTESITVNLEILNYIDEGKFIVKDLWSNQTGLKLEGFLFLQDNNGGILGEKQKYLENEKLDNDKEYTFSFIHFNI